MHLGRFVIALLPAWLAPGLALGQPVAPAPVGPAPAAPAPVSPVPAEAPRQPVATPAPVQAPVAPAAQVPAPAPAAQAPAAPVSAPAPPPAMPAPAAPAEPPPAPEETSPHAEHDRESWYEALDLSAFVDAYYSINSNLPKPQEGRNGLRIFDQDSGFALSWAALNVGYSSDAVGVNVDLRLGPSASILAGDDANHDLQYLKQAFASWRPMGTAGGLSLDFGKFDGIYGLEGADSHTNANYTRGRLYAYVPAFHTGLRGSYAFTDSVSATLLVTNGWDRTIDNNAGKSFGAQVVGTVPRDDGGTLVLARAGYMVGPENVDFYSGCPEGGTFQASPEPTCVSATGSTPPLLADRGETNAELRHLVDVVVQVEPTSQLLFALNAVWGRDNRTEQLARDFVSDPVEWYGAALLGRYQIDPVWAGALRGEYVVDDKFLVPTVTVGPDGPEPVKLTTLTGTVEAAPTDHLLLRLDLRADLASEEVFPRLRTKTESQYTATLGVVATTN